MSPQPTPVCARRATTELTALLAGLTAAMSVDDDVLAFLALLQAAATPDSDLEAIMAATKAQNNVKNQLRLGIREIENLIVTDKTASTGTS